MSEFIAEVDQFVSDAAAKSGKKLIRGPEIEAELRSDPEWRRQHGEKLKAQLEEALGTNVAQIARDMQRQANEDGITMTLSSPGIGSVSIGPDAEPAAGIIVGAGENDAGEPTLTIRRPGTDATERLRIPSDLEFEDNQSEFLPAHACEDRAEQLINRYEELADIVRVTFKVLWAKSDGKQGGKLRLGKCTKTSGTVKHYSRVDYLITLSADHCRQLNMTDRQLEALLFHELCHIAVEFDDDDNPTPKLRPHDVEAFTAEIERYGLWTAELKEMRDAAMQAALPGFDVVAYGGAQ